MKTITIIITAILLSGTLVSVNAQSKLKQNKFSVSIQGGTFLPMGNASDAYNMGGNIGLGLNYKLKSNIEIYAEANYNFIGYKSATGFDGSPSILYAGIGGRFFFGQSKYKTFIEGGAGIYMFKTPAFTFTSYITHIHIDPETGDTTFTSDPVSSKTESQTTT